MPSKRQELLPTPCSLPKALATVILLACWVNLRGCTGDVPSSSTNHWIWDYVDPPSAARDGFPFLQSAVLLAQNENDTSSNNDEALVREIAIATSCAQFTGCPNRLRFRLTGDLFSDRLEGTDGEILYKHLPTFTRQVASLADRALLAGRDAEALAISKDLILIAFLAATNGEDKVLATWRLATCKEAVRVMKAAAVADNDAELMQKLNRASADLDTEWEEVRDRDSNRLYQPLK